MSLNEMLLKLNMVGTALANDIDPGPGGDSGQLPHTFDAEPLIAEEFQSFGGILGALLNIVFFSGIALTIIFLIIGGIRYVISGGSKEGAESARSAITNAIIGFIVVIGAFTIRIIIQKMLGVTGAPESILPSF